MPLQKASGPPCPPAWCWLWRPSESRCLRWSIFLTKSWYPLSLGWCWRGHPTPHCRTDCKSVQSAVCVLLHLCVLLCGSVVPRLLMSVKKKVFWFFLWSSISTSFIILFDLSDVSDSATFFHRTRSEWPTLCWTLCTKVLWQKGAVHPALHALLNQCLRLFTLCRLLNWFQRTVDCRIPFCAYVPFPNSVLLYVAV